MKRGQIWVETVIYTLIAFVMIGLVLGYALPKIRELQDKAVIDQSISTLKGIDVIILNLGGPGNQRVLELSVKKGNLIIDGINDKIAFEIEGSYTYSEPGVTITDGNIFVNTVKTGDYNLVNLTRDYSAEYNITYIGKDELKTISKTLVSYTLIISNKGKGKFTTTDTCATSDECPDITGFLKDCVGEVCEYTEERTQIELEVK